MRLLLPALAVGLGATLRGASAQSLSSLGLTAAQVSALDCNSAISTPAFQAFVLLYKKSYGPSEWRQRCQVWKQNVVDLLNDVSGDADLGVTYDLEINSFFDYTPEEMTRLAHSVQPMTLDNSTDASSSSAEEEEGGPSAATRKLQTTWSSLDYTTTSNPSGMRLVTSVKDQGKCGSCWAHASVAAFESQVAKVRGGALEDLSTQIFVDCTPNYCNGASIFSPFVSSLFGVASAAQYPVNPNTAAAATTGSCTGLKGALPDAQIKDYGCVKGCDASAIMTALQQYGPVVVTMTVDSRMMAYKTGVLRDTATDLTTRDQATCLSKISHAMTIVGYGTDAATGLNFWKLKNSWGTGWGEGGYIRIRRQASGCGHFCVQGLPLFMKGAHWKPNWLQLTIHSWLNDDPTDTWEDLQTCAQLRDSQNYIPLASYTPPEEEGQKGLSAGAVVGIGLGAAAALALVAALVALKLRAGKALAPTSPLAKKLSPRASTRESDVGNPIFMMQEADNDL